MSRLWFIVWLVLIAGLGYLLRGMGDPATMGYLALAAWGVAMPVLHGLLAVVLLVRLFGARLNPLWLLLAMSWLFAASGLTTALLTPMADLEPALAPVPVRIAAVTFAVFIVFLAAFPGQSRPFRRLWRMRLARLLAFIAGLAVTLTLLPLVVTGAAAAFPFARLPPVVLETATLVTGTITGTLAELLPVQMRNIQVGLALLFALALMLVLLFRMTSRLPIEEPEA